VHLVGFIVMIYHDARSHERKKKSCTQLKLLDWLNKSPKTEEFKDK
jgi:hypothetical protein